MIELIHYSLLSACLFLIAVLGFVTQRDNVIGMLMCVELLLLSVSTQWVAFARFGHSVEGEVFTLAILSVAAAESAIGLAIIVLLYRKNRSVSAASLTELKN